MISINSYSQSTDRLDNLNGYRQFKFGSNPSTFKGIILQPNYVKFKGVTNYSYTGNDIHDFYGVPISSLTLSFYNLKLYMISIGFGTSQTEYSYSQFDLVMSNLIANFGSDTYKAAASAQAEIINGTIWVGRFVTLENLRLNLRESDGTRNSRYNYIQGLLLFTNKKIQQEQQQAELDF